MAAILHQNITQQFGGERDFPTLSQIKWVFKQLEFWIYPEIGLTPLLFWNVTGSSVSKPWFKCQNTVYKQTGQNLGPTLVAKPILNHNFEESLYVGEYRGRTELF